MTTKEQEAKRAEYYVERLRLSGYKVNPPAAPTQRQTQSISESYDYGDDRERPNGWLPPELQGRDGKALRALANRRIPWQNVCKETTPDEVLQSMCSMLAYSLLSPNDLRRMSPDTEL